MARSYAGLTPAVTAGIGSYMDQLVVSGKHWKASILHSLQLSSPIIISELGRRGCDTDDVQWTMSLRDFFL